MQLPSSSEREWGRIRSASLHLARILREALRGEGELAERFADERSVMLASPAEIGAASLAVFLYRVAPAALARNLPEQRSRHGRAYELEYLLVPQGGSAAQDQLILETCLRALEASPRVAEGGVPYGEFELAVSLAELTLEDSTRLWRALGRPYRLSIGVRARLVERSDAEKPQAPGPPEPLAPGVYVEERTGRAKPIEGVETSTAGFAGAAQRGPIGSAEPVASYGDFARLYGEGLDATAPTARHLALAVRGFFENGGRSLHVARAKCDGGAQPSPADLAEAIGLLARLDAIGILAAPGCSDPAVHAALLEACQARRFAILDPAPGSRIGGGGALDVLAQRAPLDSPDGALYYPWLRVADPGKPADAHGALAPPSGHVAGIYARLDRERGVHEAPGNEPLAGAHGLEVALGDRDQELLNPEGINAIRDFHAAGKGLRLWGARTLSRDGEWKYVSVRRFAIFLERSIQQGLDWVVFEPNGEPLWTRMRAMSEDFLLGSWRSGALQGHRPQDAFFVRIDRTTMTQSDLDEGRLTMLVGFAPLKPAEFVLLRLGWWTREAD